MSASRPLPLGLSVLSYLHVYNEGGSLRLVLDVVVKVVAVVDGGGEPGGGGKQHSCWHPPISLTPGPHDS